MFKFFLYKNFSGRNDLKSASVRLVNWFAGGYLDSLCCSHFLPSPIWCVYKKQTAMVTILMMMLMSLYLYLTHSFVLADMV